MSSDLERLRDLLSKTEKNIKIIEAVNGNFALAVLNEWRYSTWHVLSACLDEEGKKEEQMARAERHLRRSYFDSCDLLLDCLLDRVGAWRHGISGYESVVTGVFPQYAAVIDAARAAQKASIEVDSYTSDDRVAKYTTLESSIVAMQTALEQICDAEPIVCSAIRKAKIKTIWQFIIGIATITGVLIAIFKD